MPQDPQGWEQRVYELTSLLQDMEAKMQALLKRVHDSLLSSPLLLLLLLMPFNGHAHKQKRARRSTRIWGLGSLQSPLTRTPSHICTTKSPALFVVHRLPTTKLSSFVSLLLSCTQSELSASHAGHAEELKLKCDTLEASVEEISEALERSESTNDVLTKQTVDDRLTIETLRRRLSEMSSGPDSDERSRDELRAEVEATKEELAGKSSEVAARDVEIAALERERHELVCCCCLPRNTALSYHHHFITSHHITSHFIFCGNRKSKCSRSRRTSWKRSGPLLPRASSGWRTLARRTSCGSSSRASQR